MARMAVTEQMYQAAYRLGADIWSRRITYAEARRELEAEYGLKTKTVNAYLRAYDGLRRGRTLKLTPQVEALRYMVTRLTDDIGPAALLPALQSLGGHIEYLDSFSSTPLAKQSSLRSLYEELLLRLSPIAKTTDEDEIFAQQVADSLAASASERTKRLADASPLPQIRHQIVKTFRRNPDVVAEVLLRANGKCEGCRLPAPFQRPDGSLYLEVHHVNRLADGGHDTVDNALALCPNCHRERHFGRPPN
ncbi:HNH endonuclease [Pseudomonas guariconensis]|uniref:HNH endonuclease n=1 Tax=Pseudomonas guariconensis TaxID=1288410 RepID=UPI00387137A2